MDRPDFPQGNCLSVFFALLTVQDLHHLAAQVWAVSEDDKLELVGLGRERGREGGGREGGGREGGKEWGKGGGEGGREGRRQTLNSSSLGMKETC